MNKIETLLANLQRGNTKAFDMLRGELWYTLQSASGRLSLDADWMQEAQSILYQQAKNWNLNNSEDFETFIYGLVWRSSDKYYYEHYRKIQRKTDSEASSSVLEKLSDSGDSLASKADKRWLKNRVIDLLEDNLEADERRILKLYFFQEKTHDQISEFLGVSRPAITQRLGNILRKLKALPEFGDLWQNSRGLY